jgi:tyrosyl-tRNA synthetase
MDLFKLLTYVTVEQARDAGIDVVKQQKNVTLGSLVYPLMQAIDETVLSADVELGGIDQIKIFTLSRNYIENLGYSKCTYLMNELLPSLVDPNSKMSSSELHGQIRFTDEKETIDIKIRDAYCVEGEVKNNPCIMIAKLIVFPMGYTYLHRDIKEYESNNVCSAPQVINDNYNYEFYYNINLNKPWRCVNYEQIEYLWIKKLITEKQIKDWLIFCVDDIISPIRQKIKENIDIYNKAFI